ncbi:MAG: hypothetical protein EOM24_30330 [Chloroflexia bacterium]|nr:hypothetical protein [Chloroflexia bacterium]
MPIALIYLGEAQRLMMLFGYDETLTGEEVTVGPWQVTLQPGLNQRYRVALRRDPDPVSDAEATNAAIPPNLVDPTAFMLIEATGFTRAELLALIATLRPFDAEHLATQRHLFAGPDFGSPEAHGSDQATQSLVPWRGAAPRRFSAFWRRLETEALRPTGSGPQAYLEQSS